MSSIASIGLRPDEVARLMRSGVILAMTRNEPAPVGRPVSAPVAAAIRDYLAGGLTQREAAERHGVSQGAIQHHRRIQIRQERASFASTLAAE